jgi:hypothetical protein
MNDPQHTGSELPDYPSESTASATPAKAPFLTWGRLRILLILVMLASVTPFAYRAAKSWRAGRLIAEAERARALGDEGAAMGFMRQALALSPGTRSVQRSVEFYNARVGDKPTLAKITARMMAGKSDSSELLGLAELSAAAGDYASMQKILAKLPAELDATGRMRLAMIRSVLAAASGGPADGAASLLDAAKEAGGAEAGYLTTRAAYYLLAGKEPAEIRRAFGLLLQVAGSGTEAAAPAWRAAAQIALVPDAISQGTVTKEELQRLIDLYPKLSHTRPQDELLAADLSIRNDPSVRDAVVKRLGESRARAERSAQLEYARWLNVKGLSAEVLRFAGNERYRDDTDWLLVVLDAKSSRKEWDAVATLLDSPAGSGIPDAVRHLFLARAALMQGKQSEADQEWAALATALRLEKPETLAYVAGYEEQLGLLEQAQSAYREMALRKETHVKGLVGTIRCQPANAPASTLIPLYEELTAASPEFADAGGDLSYLRMLCWYDVPDSLAAAQKLLAAQPSSLARISVVALGLLRNGDPKQALALYEGKQIDWASAPLPWRAVRIAVLRANGREEEASALASKIDQRQLRPEERALIAPAKGSPSSKSTPASVKPPPKPSAKP